MTGRKKVAPNLTVDFAGVSFKNPVVTASGTFGSGKEYAEFVELSKLGAVVTKGVSLEPWEGNPVPRIAETPSGMLNAIGLQNPGIETFLESDLPFLKKYDTRVIVNVCGHSVEEYAKVAERLSEADVDMLEINISCPNVKEGGIAFGTDPRKAAEVTRAVKKASKKPVIMKLSPNVTDITEMAKACEDAGADALSLINTITGMKIDVETRRFLLSNKTGGLSGPAIHPIAVRMVYEVYNAVKLPIIGIGGITDSNDAIEMMLAGASLVAVGTASFRRPDSAVRVINGIEDYLFSHGIDDVRKLTGAVRKK